MNKFIKCLSAILCGVGALFAVSKVNAYSLDSNGNIVSANLADSNCFKKNSAINANGNYYSLSGYDCYYKIPLTPGSTYTISFNNSEITTRDIAFYDVNGNFISINNGYNIVGFTLPSNVYYISFDFRNDLTNIMINTGASVLPYEPYGTWYNENYLRSFRMGIFSNLDYLQPYINNRGFDEYSINDLFNNGLITSDNSINLISISDNINTSYEPIEFDFYLNDYISKSQFKLSFSNVAYINSFKIGGYNSANPNIDYVYTLSINELPKYFDLTDYETNNLDYINYFSVFFNNADQVVNVNGNIDYYSGYNAGLEVANRWQNMYNELESSYNSLKNQYNDLLRQYNNYINGNVTLDTLIWNIATTPFETFKTIWDVDVLGVNLGSLCVGLMFVGIALYIWRKFI